MRLDPARFAGDIDGRAVELIVLRNEAIELAVCNHGARILQLIVPDRRGRAIDVVLGHDSLEQMLAGMPSMGAFIGRYANRIANARFTLDGRQHLLPANDGPHCVHGGPGGSRHQVFEVLERVPQRERFEPCRVVGVDARRLQRGPGLRNHVEPCHRESRRPRLPQELARSGAPGEHASPGRQVPLEHRHPAGVHLGGDLRPFVGLHLREVLGPVFDALGRHVRLPRHAALKA